MYKQRYIARYRLARLPTILLAQIFHTWNRGRSLWPGCLYIGEYLQSWGKFDFLPSQYNLQNKAQLALKGKQKWKSRAELKEITSSPFKFLPK